MEKSNKRGKIPQADWPLIMTRYEAGETLASIARTYDCSPPAISYVVSKSRARQPSPDRPAADASGPESQLIKSMTCKPAASGSAKPARLHAPELDVRGLDATAAVPTAHGGAERRAETMSTGSDTAAGPAAPPGSINGFLRDSVAARAPDLPHASVPIQAHPPSSAEAGSDEAEPGETKNGRPAPVGTGAHAAGPSPPARSGADARHRLHLSVGHGSLGNGTSSYDVSDDKLFPLSARSVADNSRPAAAPAVPLPFAAPSRPSATGFEAADRLLRQDGREAGSDAASRDQGNKEGAGAFIDHRLRARVDTDIAAFLAAFDAALTQDTQENRSALREATDRLLRAGARTRIELERLEARVPLSAHDNGRADPGAWRYR